MVCTGVWDLCAVLGGGYNYHLLHIVTRLFVYQSRMVAPRDASYTCVNTQRCTPPHSICRWSTMVYHVTCQCAGCVHTPAMYNAYVYQALDTADVYPQTYDQRTKYMARRPWVTLKSPKNSTNIRKFRFYDRHLNWRSPIQVSKIGT